MNDTDKKRLEEAVAAHDFLKERGIHDDEIGCTVCFLISHLKDATAVLSRVRELHKPSDVAQWAGSTSKRPPYSYCLGCKGDYPCSTIAILDGGEG